MQQRVDTAFDQEIEDLGWERIRSKVVVETKDGRTLERWADENYRGSPHNPLSDAEVEGKFRDCAAGLLDVSRVDAVLQIGRASGRERVCQDVEISVGARS